MSAIQFSQTAELHGVTITCVEDLEGGGWAFEIVEELGPGREPDFSWRVTAEELAELLFEWNLPLPKRGDHQ